jgi:hypothetical protein
MGLGRVRLRQGSSGRPTVTVVKSLFGGVAALVLAYFAWVYALMRRFPGGTISITLGVFLQPGMLLREFLIFAAGFVVVWRLCR